MKAASAVTEPATPPRFHPPMLATLERDPRRVSGNEWVFERKLDGHRIIAVCTEQGARLFSRSGHDVTVRFPFADDLPRRDCVLDGEAVAFLDGRESFAHVQRGQATHLVLFDILHLDGHALYPHPWRERRALLDDLTLGPRCARLPATDGDPAPMLARACAAGWEGLIAKRTNAPYQPGRRSPAWRKLKCVQGQEFVIGGFTEPGGTRSGLGALLVGYHDTERGFRYAGKVGTGFDEATLHSLRDRLDGLERPDPPFSDPPTIDAHWVEPWLVCRVDFTEWTPDGRLRHPRFLGLRDDKPPVEVVREA